MLLDRRQADTISEFEVGGYHAALPSVDIHTIGAGGGTIAGVDRGGLLFVGPQGAAQIRVPQATDSAAERRPSPTPSWRSAVCGRVRLPADGPSQSSSASRPWPVRSRSRSRWAPNALPLGCSNCSNSSSSTRFKRSAPSAATSRPVFVDGELYAFVCNRAHQSDIGGGVAGTYNPAATEIFHEGIRLPPLRLVERGETRRDLWDLLLLNSRCPDLLDGDLLAMMGSTRIGADEMEALAADLGPRERTRYLEGILDHAERRMRAAISELPDGVYEGAEMTDNDCFTAREIWIRVRITKSGDSLHVDYSATDPQMKGFKNSSYSNTRSATYVALTSFLDPDIPRNEGTYRCVTVEAPLGTLVDRT